MKSFTVLILLAFIFGGVTQIYAAEDAVEDVAEVAAPVADAADPLADVADVAPVLEVVENVAKAVADAAQAAVDAAGESAPGAVVPSKIASEVINIIKDKIAAFRAALDDSKGAHPIFNIAQGLLRPKI
ncbi:hypothetical protein FF38_08167 [Lucilia cuprina]|uniref:Uncharacterized protein n=1 Tax=Lucilia cuprina TaxID=7375 RepID=A0A0L0C0R4_LUCCU|nr:hypothetical protein FF38_08167 [Lucilia cuprina]